MKVFKNIVNTIINILIVLVLVISVLVATLALTSKSSGISNVFGYTFQVVMSDSMDGGSDEYEGGDFKKGDVIIGKVTKNDKLDTPGVYEKGDIITYKGFLQGNSHLGEQLICHRVIDVQERDGVLVYQTQGDNRSVSQLPDQVEVSEYITAYEIVAIYDTADYTGIKIAGVGKIYEFINSQLGFFLCILLPMIIFFLYVLIKVVINFVEYKKSKDDEKRGADTGAPQMSAEEYEEFKKFQEMKNAQAAQEAASTDNEE